jgi:hypothetical protein
VYKTELWVTALDLPNNLPHNRYVLGMDVMGFQVSQAVFYNTRQFCFDQLNWPAVLHRASGGQTSSERWQALLPHP